MKRIRVGNSCAALCVPALLLSSGSWAAEPKECRGVLAADEPVVAQSIEQEDINEGMLSFDEVNRHGALLFAAKFNACDGRGRPLTTGGGDARLLPTLSEEGEPVSAGQVAKLRTSAPDSDSCGGCHNEPELGGAGDFVANVFVLAQTLDPMTLSVSPARSNSRNTLGMHGSGAIEMLAREMTDELQGQLADVDGQDGHYTFWAKGISFDVEIAGGEVVEAEGVDHDLVIKPFHQAGKVTSLREFTANAMNHHHGMQAEERFDLNPAKNMDPDFDGDGVERELTIGDVTAVTIWQAQLSVPVQVMPDDRKARKLVRSGERVFEKIGCDSCHVPVMKLTKREFVEPNPYNPPGTCASAGQGCPDYSFDLTEDGDFPQLEKGPKGSAFVRAYTDLKRHNLCDEPDSADAIRWFCNEQLAQGRPDQDGKPGTEFFLTRKLWDVGNTAPYGHRGDLSTITEAILMHGGEGRASRDAFASSELDDQKAVVAFLKSLQIVPQSAVDP